MNDIMAMAEKNKILEMVVGSHLYGTSTPLSDKDYSGVFVADREYYTGLRKVNEVDLSIVDKLDSGKNSKDAVDRKLYELRKFFTLAMENNPNLIEQMFCPSNCVIYKNEFGQRLLDYNYLFPYRGCKQKFLGYAFSQKHKMLIKPENYAALVEGMDFLGDILSSDKSKNKNIIEGFKESNSPFDFKENFVELGDLRFNPKDSLVVVFDKISARILKAGCRTEIFLKHGYDTKFGSHLVRLMIEGLELLETGRICFPLKEADFILDIKNGKYTAKEIVEISEDFESKIDAAEKKSILPVKPRFEEIEKVLMEMVDDFHNGYQGS